MIYSLNEIKTIVTPIAEQYEARRLFLFGSFARGDQNADSDIDLRLEMGRTLGLFALSGFALDLERAFGRKIDLLTTGGLDAAFLEAIKGEEVLIYDSNRS